LSQAGQYEEATNAYQKLLDLGILEGEERLAVAASQVLAA